MKLENRNIITISVDDYAREQYKILEKNKPAYISFSKMLAVCVESYLKKQENTPNINDDINIWIAYIKNLDKQEYKKLKQKIQQLNTFFNLKNKVI